MEKANRYAEAFYYIAAGACTLLITLATLEHMGSGIRCRIRNMVREYRWWLRQHEFEVYYQLRQELRRQNESRGESE